MLNWFWYAATQCMAWSIVETSTAPLRPATLTATSVLLGATPVYAPAALPTESAPLPPTMPAITVPCP